VGKNRRISTKEESLAKAKEIAEDWYLQLQLRGKLRSGEIKPKRPFATPPNNTCANPTSSPRGNAALAACRVVD